MLNVPGLYARNMAYLGSSTDLTEDIALDVGFRYVDNTANVGSYLVMDLRLGWQLENGMELAFVGQNLLDNVHTEFMDPTQLAYTSGVQRGVFAVLSWEF